MTAVRNVSMPSGYARALDFLHMANGSVQVVPITTAVICLGITLFYEIGRLMGNPRSRRASALLAAAVLLALRNVIFQMLSQCLTMSVGFYLAGTLLLQAGTATATATAKFREEQSAVNEWPDRPFLPPMVFPSRTTHTRLAPQTHSFAYSYLLVGVPVSWQGIAGVLLSAGQDTRRHGWFSVVAEDYLARGPHKCGLKGKLDDYLLSQGISADRYPFAYLVTAPRFLGFSFNPVSFWYLYDGKQNLAAMILEVNNTFDERRMYFMERRADNISNTAAYFSNTWFKDFHVSPFNDRKGSYSLTAKDVQSGDHGTSLDNSIVLRDVEGNAKIVAKVFSTEPGIATSDMSMMASLYFLARWSWVGFMTNPRILKEARTLWGKKLQVYYRPEVLKTSIGRVETAQEAKMEPFFRSYLLELLRGRSDEIDICYQPAAGPDRDRKLHLRSDLSSTCPPPRRTLEIRVLTPAFYGDLVRGRSVEETCIKTCFQATEGEAMLYVSDHYLLQQWLRQIVEQRSTDQVTFMPFSRRQALTSYLRSRGKKGSSGCCLDRGQHTVRSTLRASEFDCFISQHHPGDAYKAYLHHANLLLLADQIAFGFGSVLSLYVFAVHWTCIAQVCSAAREIWMQGWTQRKVLSLMLYTVLSHASMLYWV